MVAIFGFSRDKILAAVQDMYTAVATTPDHSFHFPVGRDACRQVGYPAELLDDVPDLVLERRLPLAGTYFDHVRVYRRRQ